MKKEELLKLKEFVKELDKIPNPSDSSVPYDLEGELFQFFDELMSKYNWTIIADDTHRWVETDGWYEVAFYLITDFTERIYINTESGDIDLQNDWSENNPQEVDNIRECYMDTVWDWNYFLVKLINDIEIAEANGKLEYT